MDDAADRYIASLDEPRRSEISALDQFITRTLPDQDRVALHDMVGYGPIRYKYASGREGETCRVCLASKKNYITLYCFGADDRGYVAERYRGRLPKASIGKSCVRFKRLGDLDLEALRELLVETVKAGWG